MSALTNIVNTVFRARDGGLIAQLGGYAQGFGTITNRLRDNVSMSQRVSNQWRAMQTTMRYAIAGQAVFGLTRMLGQLKDINYQIGQMAALTTAGTGGSAFSMQQVDDLANRLQSTALNTMTPLSQVNDAAINFLSTVQNVPPGGALPSMLEDISKAAQVAQTDLTTLTQAATTSQVQFGRKVTPTTTGQFTRMWQELILQAPGGQAASTTIAQALPGLATMFMMGRGQNVTPAQGQAQMMGIILGLLRTGMPAATAMRGGQYLLQSIEQPTGKSKAALARIGITPEFIQKNGIYAALMRLLGGITQTGNAKQLGAIPEDVMDQLDQDQNAGLPGIPASEMTRLREMIPRIHGVRAAIILASQLRQQGNVLSIGQDVQEMQDVQDDQSKQSKALADAWKRFQKKAALQEAANAINTMAIQVAQTFTPVLNFVASHGVTPIAHGMQHHRDLTKKLTYGGVGAIGLYSISRLLGIGPKWLPGLGGLGRAGMGVQAVEASLQHPGQLGASPLNPMYVIVVGQLFGGGMKGLKKGLEDLATGKGAQTAEQEAEQVASKKGFWGIVKSVGRKAATPATFVAGAAAKYGARAGRFALEHPTRVGRVAGPVGLAAIVADYFYNAQNAGVNTESLYQTLQQQHPEGIISRLSEKKIQGEAWVNFTLDISHDGKVTHKRFHIPVSMAYQGGRHPSQGGKPKTTRGHR